MTARQLSFHPDAIEEAEAAARWYRQVVPVLPEDSLMNSTMPLTELWMHHNAGLLDHAALASSSSPVFPSSLFIDRLTLRFRFLRLRTVDGDGITGKPDSSISAPFYCFASHACEQPVFEWV